MSIHLGNNLINKSKFVTFQDAFVRMFPEFAIDGKDVDDKGTLPIKNFTFIVTKDCNLKCSYCYQICKNSSKMSRKVARDIIDMLFREYDNENSSVNYINARGIVLDFIGGEPFLEIELMDYIVEYFKYKAMILNHPWAKYFMISISTNGTLYEDERVQKFIRKNHARLSCSITIDGNKELHDSCRLFQDGSGSYDTVEKSIKKQIQDFGNSVTKLTLAPENISYFNEAVKNLHSIGMNHVNANCIFEEGWTKEHALILYQEMKKLADYIIDGNLITKFSCSIFDETIGMKLKETDNQNWCGGTGKMLCADPDGVIYPCLRYVDYSLGVGVEPIVIGNTTDGIGNLEEHRKTIDCLECITRRSQSTDECFNCEIGSGCAWCSAYNYQKLGSVNKRATFICIMHKARVMANAYYYNKLLRSVNNEDRMELNIPKEWALEIISEDEYNMLLELSK